MSMPVVLRHRSALDEDDLHTSAEKSGGTIAIVLDGGDLAETLVGGDGDDTLNGNGGDDILIGGLGNDTLNGGDGVDTASYVGLLGGVAVRLGVAGPQGTLAGGFDTLVGIENLIGTSFNDRLEGDAGANRIQGGAGFDTIYGGDGADLLEAGDGGGNLWNGANQVTGLAYEDNAIDTLIGGAGGDVIFVGLGDVADGGSQGAGQVDRVFASLFALGSGITLDLSAGDGFAILAAVTGGSYSNFEEIGVFGTVFSDTIIGTAGNDRLFDLAPADGAGGDDVLLGGAGNDFLSGGSGANHMDGGVGNDIFYNTSFETDTMIGGAGDDLVLYGSSAPVDIIGDGDDIVSGGAGVDTITYERLTVAIAVDLRIVTAQETGFNSLTVSGVENLIGGSGDDSFIGAGAANRFSGRAGADTLNGGGGADLVEGGDGDDTLIGNIGVDTLIGGAGNDTLRGGSAGDVIDGGDGIDTATYSSSTVRVNINLGAGFASGGEASGDTLAAVENITGSAFNDIIAGDSAANVFLGGLGDDVLQGAGGADVLVGAAGADLLDGGDGDDEVQGGAGNDTLNGGLGIDILVGGAGADRFLFNTLIVASNADTIADFSVPNDTIELENATFVGIGPAGALGVSRFVVGAAAADASDRIIYDAATGALYWDPDGTGAAAQVKFAQLTIGLALTAADFVVV